MGFLNKFLTKSTANTRSSEVRRPSTFISCKQLATPCLPSGNTVSQTHDITWDELGAPKAVHDLKETAKDNSDPIPVSPQRAQISFSHVKGSTTSATVEPVLSSTNSNHSGRGSHRLVGLTTLFRSRKAQQKRVGLDLPSKKYDLHHEDNADQPLDPLGGTVRKDRPENVQQSESDLQQAPEIRKVSDKTDYSTNSNVSGITICRRPSKRASMPITLVDQKLAHPNPFDDSWQTSHSDTSSSNPFSDPSKSLTHSTTHLSSTYSEINKPVTTFPRHIFDLSSSTQANSFCLSVPENNSWPTIDDRRLAAISFNELASELYLDPLGLIDSDGCHTKEEVASGEDNLKLPRRRGRFFGRMRTMRSTLHMKSEITEMSPPQSQGLRRRKTFSGLSFRPCLMTSLKGKSLETLARLGGYSFLSLPGDFAPATLNLPVCFVAIINYLRCFGPMVRNLFFDAGDINTAAQTYDFFASQVLTAEKDQSRIQMTMRSGNMPSFLTDNLDLECTGKSSAQILGVAWTFKVLLSGVPGGILGSIQLYRVLASIYYGLVPKGPIKRMVSGLGGLSPETYAKVRAASLALVALTSSMQLNLICAVFGLCTLLLHETERISELERLRVQGVCGTSLLSPGALSVERFGEILGPLLIDPSQDQNPDSFQAIEHEIESQRVVSLLVENWRSVSRQLRVWEHRSAKARVSAGSWTQTASDVSMTGT